MHQQANDGCYAHAQQCGANGYQLPRLRQGRFTNGLLDVINAVLDFGHSFIKSAEFVFQLFVPFRAEFYVRLKAFLFNIG